MTPPEVRELVHQVRNFLTRVDIRAEALAQALRSLARNAGSARQEICLPTVQHHLASVQTLFHEGANLISETQQRLAAETRP